MPEWHLRLLGFMPNDPQLRERKVYQQYKNTPVAAERSRRAFRLSGIELKMISLRFTRQ